MTCSYAVLLTLLSAFSAFAQLGSTNPGQAPAAGSRARRSVRIQTW